MKSRADRTQDLIADLVDEGGMVDYVRRFQTAEPRTWDDATWEALRERLWQDCYDGDRYAWQPLVPLIRSIYERQLEER